MVGICNLKSACMFFGQGLPLKRLALYKSARTNIAIGTCTHLLTLTFKMNRFRMALPCWTLLIAMAFAPRPVCAQQAQSTAQDALSHGLTLIKEKHIDEAIRVFEAGLEREPKNPTLLNAVGAAYSLKGDSEQAQSYFLRCLAVDPEFSSAHRNLGISYFNAGRKSVV